MGVKIKGGHTTIVGKGKVNIGPTIPTNGLVLYVDPATLLNSTNTDSLVARSPLTSSTFTVGTSATATAPYDVTALQAGPSNTLIGTKNYPTGALTPVFYGNAPNYMSEGNDLFITGVYIGSNALNLLRQHVKREMTIVVWWSGVGISTSYPATARTNAGADKSFLMGLNNWPPYGNPNEWPDNPTINSGQYSAFLAHRQTVAAANGRTYNDFFSNLPFVATSSMLTDSFQSASVGPNTHYGLSASVAPTYTSASAALPNIPYWYRGINNNFAGRTVYNTNDFWNCTAFVANKGVTNPDTVTQSIFMNGALYGTRSGATSSFTIGTRHRGSISAITTYDLSPSQTASFYLLSGAGNSRLNFVPQNPPGPDVYNSTDQAYTFYFATASAYTDTIANLVAKINSPISSASLYISASAVSTTGIAITGSLPGILNASTFNFTSSVQSRVTLFTLRNGSQNSGTGPIQDIFAIPPINTNYVDAISIGAINTAATVTGKNRNGTVGAIGGIYIYNRQLTQQEIAQIYNTQKGKYGNIRPSGVPVRPYRIMNPYDSSNQETPPASSGIGY